MNILILSQVFWPDSASTSQHLADLAEDLVGRDHVVEVISSRRDYENPGKQYKEKESYKGIRISRIWGTGFGKATIVGRLSDFMTFNIALFLKLLVARKRRYDLIIGMTSPPLVSLIGVLLARWKKARFLYWVMDMQPELSITAGYVKEDGTNAKLLLKLGDYIYRRADRVIVLDKYMKNHVVSKGVPPNRINVIPVWPVMKDVYNGNRLDNPFRVEKNLGDKIVVMYSGNHSVVHPLDTLLEAIRQLRHDDRLLFVFIGAGVRKEDVTSYKTRHQLDNILQFPYQPRDRMHISLGAADLHVVIQGNNCIGFTHPNKIYGAMYVGRPVLYIGPSPSHISDILDKCRGNISVAHEESRRLQEELTRFADMKEGDRNSIGDANNSYVAQRYSREALVGEMIRVIELGG